MEANTANVRWMLEVLRDNGFSLSDVIDLIDQLASIKVSPVGQDEKKPGDSKSCERRRIEPWKEIDMLNPIRVSDERYPELMQKISTILKDFRISESGKGFCYLREAIEIYYSDRMITQGQALQEIAEHYKTTASAVERSMRYAITGVKDFLEGEEAAEKYRIVQWSTKAFCAAIADYLRLEDAYTRLEEEV